MTTDTTPFEPLTPWEEWVYDIDEIPEWEQPAEPDPS